MAKPQLADSITPLEATRQLLDVSVTELGQYRTCRRRWGLETLDNLVPVHHDELPFEFGAGIHRVLEVYYRELGELPGLRGLELAQHQALAAWEAWKDEAEDRFRHGTDEEWDTFLEHCDLGDSMLEQYFKFDQVSPVQLGQPLAVEGLPLAGSIVGQPPEGYPESARVHRHESGRLLVPIVDPNTKEPIQGEPYLTARIDLLTERKTPKLGLWVNDHKTASSAPSDRGLDFDEQATGYCYVVLRWLGLIPRGVIWNVLLKNIPKEPRLVQSKKRSEGLVLSTAKDQLTTPNMYRDALKEHGLLVGGKVTSERHAECLAALLARGWDPFFRRYELTRNLEELMSFEARLVEQYDDMWDSAIERKVLYPNLSSRHCPQCSVKTICQAMEDGSDAEDVVEHNFKEGPDRKARH